MKLLICTQKVDQDDAVLGFFHSWLQEFAKHAEELTVICLYKGEYNLPNNVKVLSLGKESLLPTAYRLLPKIKYTLRFYKYIWQHREDYGKIFVHMNPEYVVLGGIFWKIWKKKIALWYVHRSVPWQLRIAEKFVDIIFTASRESFRLKSDKVKVVGHGIDLSQLRIKNEELRIDTNTKQSLILNSSFLIIYVGRISPIKDQKLLVEAVDILVNQKDIKNIQVKLVGGPLNLEDMKYERELLDMIKEKKLADAIEYAGAVPNKDIARHYNEADLAVNLCPTGGMDKAVLEAMAAGLPVIALNQTFAGLIDDPDLLLATDQAEELARKIEKVKSWGGERLKEKGEKLKEKVEEKYSLENLVKKILFFI